MMHVMAYNFTDKKALNTQKRKTRQTFCLTGFNLFGIFFIVIGRIFFFLSVLCIDQSTYAKPDAHAGGHKNGHIIGCNAKSDANADAKAHSDRHIINLFFGIFFAFHTITFRNIL